MCLAAALGAFAVGGDVYAGANAGENAAEYNAWSLIRKGYKIAKVIREKGRNTTWRDLADAVGSEADLRTIANSNASGIERIIAAVSLASDLWFGVSARDLDYLRNIIRRGDSAADSARLRMQLAAEQAAGVRMPTDISGYTRHGLNQAISRDGVGVSGQAILNAWRTPSKIEFIPTDRGPSFRLTGNEAVVIVNARGQVVTTWARTSSGVRN